MVASQDSWRSSKSNWIWVVCLIGLAGGLIGLTVYSTGLFVYEYWPRVLAVPGQAQHDLGQKRLADGDGKEAVSAFTAAINASSGYAPYYFNRAEAYQLLNETDKAIDDYTAALLIDPGYADAYYRRAALYLEKCSPELAIDDLTQAILIAPDLREAVYLRTRANLAAGKYFEAVDDARLAIRLSDKGDTFGNPGPLFPPADDQQAQRAVEYVIGAIQLGSPLSKPVKSELARSYFKWAISLSGKPVAAETAFNAADQIDPSYVALHVKYKAASGLASNGFGPRYYVTLLPIDPDPKLSHALDLLWSEKFDDAIKEFTAILLTDAHRNDAWAWYGRGLAFLEKNDPVAAIADFEHAIDLAPGFAAAYCQRGRAYMKKDNCYQALLDFSEAIRLKPDYDMAYFYRALAHLQDGNFERARTDLDKAVKLGPSAPTLNPAFNPRTAFAETCVADGLASLAERNWDNAIASLKLAISVDPSRAGQLHPRLAEAYVGAGFDQLAARHWDKAIASLEAAISLERTRAGQLGPQLAQAYRERGLEHAKRREFHEAVSDLNRALDLEKNDAQTYRICGLTCCTMAKYFLHRRPIGEIQQQWQAAIQYLNRAMWLDPSLERELQAPLHDAVRNLDNALAQTSATSRGP